MHFYPYSIIITPCLQVFKLVQQSLSLTEGPGAGSFRQELCWAKLKQWQAQYYNRGAVDLDPSRRDVVRLKLFQLGQREWQKGIVQSWLDERLYEVKMPYHVVHGNRVHLQKTNEPSPPSSDQASAEVSVPLVLQSNELPTTVHREVNPPASSQEK